MQKLKQNQSHSNYSKTQSALSQKNISAITNSKILDNNINAMQKMNKKTSENLKADSFQMKLRLWNLEAERTKKLEA